MRRFILISLLCFAILAPMARADVVVIVRREAETSGNYVRVCDVARVEGPRERAREVAETIIGPTPPKGEAREISRWEIESRLYEMGYDARVTFSGNDSVRVFGSGLAMRRRADEGFVPEPLGPVAGAFGGRDGASAARTLSVPPAPASSARATDRIDDAGLDATTTAAAARDRVGLAISEYLSSRYNRKDVEVRAKVLSLSEALSPTEEFAVSEEVGGRVPGKAEVAVIVKGTNGGPGRRIVAAIDAEVLALALVAAKPLYKGNVISKNDVRVAKVRMKAGQAYMPPDPAFAEGREVQRPIKPAEPVLAADARTVDAVKQGTIVSLENTGRTWAVQANVKALAGGNVDDVIMVQDASGKNRFHARVTGPGRVAAVVPADKRNKG